MISYAPAVARRAMRQREQQPSGRPSVTRLTGRDALVDTCDVLAVRRRYLVVLVAAAVAAVLSVVIPNNGGSTTTGRSPADFALATAAADRMRLPADFVRVGSFYLGEPCPGDRCYLVARPTTAVATTMPRLLRSVATVKPHDIFCTILHASQMNLGVGWVPNRFFKVGVSLAYIGDTANTALLYDQSITSGSTPTWIPRVGASYVLAQFSNFSSEFAAGSYYAPSRFSGEAGIRPFMQPQVGISILIL